jgi:hypothetical protein
MGNEDWKMNVMKAIDEAYDGTGGIYLDPNTDLLAELRNLSGAQASTVLPGAGNSVANQLRHLLTTVAMHEAQFRGTPYPELDWGADWQPTALSDAEWHELVEKYAATRAQLKDWVTSPSVDEDNDYIFSAIMVATHLAYHVGQIRHTAAYAAHQ